MTRGNGVDFLRKVGIVCGALIAVLTLGQIAGGIAFRITVLPKMEEALAQERKRAEDAQSEERRARMYADSILGESMVQQSRDRVRLLAFMEARDARERRRQIEEARREWSKPIQVPGPYPFWKN